MLVLSRRPQEKVVIPAVGTTIQVVSVKPGVVRLAFDAPPHVKVFREEVLARAGASSDADADPVRELNRLNATGIGLELLRHQLLTGRHDEAAETLGLLEEEYRTLRARVQECAEHLRTPAPPTRRPASALVVEDDRNERELLAGLLRLAGLTVETADDGADALDRLNQRGPADFVLLDMVLPRLDGPATVRAIRRDPALGRVKIFGLSGHSSDRFDLPRGPAGVDRWFAKPLNPQELLKELHLATPA
jgi:carbon storage regulator CsrA